MVNFHGGLAPLRGDPLEDSRRALELAYPNEVHPARVVTRRVAAPTSCEPLCPVHEPPAPSPGAPLLARVALRIRVVPPGAEAGSKTVKPNETLALPRDLPPVESRNPRGAKRPRQSLGSNALGSDTNQSLPLFLLFLVPHRSVSRVRCAAVILPAAPPP